MREVSDGRVLRPERAGGLSSHMRLFPRCPPILHLTCCSVHVKSCPPSSTKSQEDGKLLQHSRVSGFPDAAQALAATTQGALGQQKLHKLEDAAVSALQRHLFFCHLNKKKRSAQLVAAELAAFPRCSSQPYMINMQARDRQDRKLTGTQVGRQAQE